MRQFLKRAGAELVAFAALAGFGVYVATPDSEPDRKPTSTELRHAAHCNWCKLPRYGDRLVPSLLGPGPAPAGRPDDRPEVGFNAPAVARVPRSKPPASHGG